MKKTLLVLMATSAVALTGCSSEESSNNNNGGCKEVPADLKPFIGTYNLDFFASAALGMGGASSNWTELDNYKNQTTITKPTVTTTTGDAKGNFIGKVTVDYCNGIKVTSKLQMKDSTFGNNILAPQQYNFTVYNEVATYTVKNNTLTFKGKGVTGRNAQVLKGIKNANDDFSFEFKKSSDVVTATSKSTDNSSLAKADVFLALTKKSDKVETLDANTQLACDQNFSGNASCKDVDLKDVFKPTPDPAPSI